jgi:hypothetical protein
MAFININKVTLEDTNDIKEVTSDLVLVLSSIIYDDIQVKKYDEALKQIEMLKCSVWQLETVLKNNY